MDILLHECQHNSQASFIFFMRSLCECDNFFIIYMIKHQFRMKRETEMFLFNNALNTFYLRLYGIRHMVKDHSDSEKGTRCRHIGYSYRLTARVLLYAPSHRQDNTYHNLCYTSRGTLAGTRNSSMGPPHEGSIRRPIAPWANALTTELHLAPEWRNERKEMFYLTTHSTHFFIYGFMALDMW